MSSTSSLQKNRPHLESVLGPLSSEENAKIRALFDEVDGVLLEIAHHFNLNRAGLEGTGLELTWSGSGQVSIGSNVGVCVDGSKCVDFCIELLPSWHYGLRSSALTWEVTCEIYADCQHSVDHGSMHCVHETSIGLDTSIASAAELLTAAEELLRLATDYPLGHWLELASDASQQAHGADSP